MNEERKEVVMIHLLFSTQWCRDKKEIEIQGEMIGRSSSHLSQDIAT